MVRNLVVACLLIQAVLGLDSRWKLIWGDEFNSPTLDTTHWTAQTTTTVYNNEAEWYTANNVYIQDGKLVLKSDHDSTYPTHPYASGKAITQDKVLITRARVEIYGKLPYGQGIWPAYWLLSNNDCDNYIMELVGSDMTTVYGSWHYSSSCSGTDTNDGRAYVGPNFSSGYHLYSVEINRTHMVYAVDNNIFYTTTAGLADYDQQPHYLILNTAVGGAQSWGGAPDGTTVFPQYNYIDYVRVYGWQPCVTGCGTHGCCDQVSQTCKCDSNYAGSNCEWQLSSSGSKAVCPTTTTATAATTASATTSKSSTSTTGSTTGTTPLTLTAPSLTPITGAPGTQVTVKLTLNTGSTNLVNGWIGFYIAPSGDMGSERQLNMTRNDQISAAPNSHITKTWTVTIPADAAAGAYWLTIACWDSSWNTLWWQNNNQGRTATLTVTAPPRPAGITLKSFSPVSAFVGGSVMASFVVTLGTVGISNGHFQMYLGPPNIATESQKIASGGYDNQNLTAGSTTSYTLSASINQGTAPGTYDLYAGVWDSSWKNVLFVDFSASLTVLSPTPSMGPFSSSKSSVARGSSITITMSATSGSSTLTGAYIGYGIVPASSPNSNQLVGQQSQVNITAGTTYTKTFTNTIPGSASTGSYRVTFGFWDSSWKLLSWQDAGLTITIR